MPEKLAQMKEIFLIEAARNNALPIGGGLFVPVFHPELRITPPETEWVFPGDFVRMPEFDAPALGNRNNRVTIDAERRLLQLEVDEAELTRRRAAWKPPVPHYTIGVLAKYARLVGSAALGAVTDGPP